MEIDILFFIANQKKLLANELKEFLDGYDGDHYNSMKALVNKIEHMCFNIGCPSSVEPMLLSIVNGKIKKWSNDSDDRGKQLTGYHTCYIENKYRSFKSGERGNLLVDTGHFRWDYQGHLLDRDDRLYIKKFFIDGNRK